MSDSNEKNPKRPANFDDDLDSMLNDAAASINAGEELMDDDSAIDQLLMDNALDAKDRLDEEGDELDKLFADGSTSLGMNDEFGLELESVPEEKQSETSPVESGSQPSVQENDEFVEIDEFAEDEFAEDPAPAASKPEQENTDFTVAEFDITYDDTSGEDIDFATNHYENSIEDSDETDVGVSESRVEPPSIYEQDKPTGSEAIDTDVAAIAAQISQLFSGQNALKQQLEEMSASAMIDHGEEIERLTQGQRALKKQLAEQLDKSPIITHIALGLAVAALLFVCMLVYLTWNTDNVIEDISQRIAALEETQEANLLDASGKDIEAVNLKIEQQNQILSELTTRLNSLTGAGSDENGAVSVSALNADLSTAINQQQKFNESIIALDDRIKRLETKRPPSAAQKTSNKTVKRSAGKAARSQNWSVNLVSFRQEWYAKRKAAEFSKKGVPTEVEAVQVKGEPWYRLTVKGFKTKAEASAYAAQVKKDFNLDSVWLGRE